jgi:hypothetical protein
MNDKNIWQKNIYKFLVKRIKIIKMLEEKSKSKNNI